MLGLECGSLGAGFAAGAVATGAGATRAFAGGVEGGEAAGVGAGGCAAATTGLGSVDGRRLGGIRRKSPTSTPLKVPPMK